LRILLSLFAVLAIPPLAFVAVWYLQGPDAPLLAFAAELFGFLRDEVPQLDLYRERLTAEGRADLMPLVTAVFSYDFFLLLFLPVPLALAHLVSPALRRSYFAVRSRAGKYESKYDLRYAFGCAFLGIILCFPYTSYVGGARYLSEISILDNIIVSEIYVLLDYLCVSFIVFNFVSCIVGLLAFSVKRKFSN